MSHYLLLLNMILSLRFLAFGWAVVTVTAAGREVTPPPDTQAQFQSPRYLHYGRHYKASDETQAILKNFGKPKETRQIATCL